MKTNVQIETSDSQRKHLANIYDNKIGNRHITRKELVQLVQLYIDELLNAEKTTEQVVQGVVEDGYRYYHNDKRVSKEEFENWTPPSSVSR